MELNLQSLRAEVGDAATPKVNDVARFKENTGDARVVADSQDFIVYSLKNGINLRVLGKAGSSQSSFKKHTSPVKSAAFVTNKSNVLYSISDTELIVWYIDQKTHEPVVYFEAKFKVTSCAWILQANTTYPDILCIRDGKVVLLKASELISKYAPDATEPLQATEEHFSPISEGDKNKTSLLCVGSGGVFGYNTDASTVITCTTRNLKTPSWKPCGKNGKIQQMTIMQSQPILVAVGENTINAWDISAEPTTIAKIALAADDKVVAIRSAGYYCAVFFASGEVSVLNFDRKFARFYKLDGPVKPNGLNVGPMKDGIAAIADFGDKLAYNFMDGTDAKRASFADKAPAASAATPSGKGVNKNDVTTPQQQIPQSYNASSIFSPGSPGATNAPPPSPAVHNAAGSQSPLMLNPALAGINAEGNLATALEVYNNELENTKNRLDSALSNATQVVKLIPQQVSRDANQLTSIALEAQSSEMQRAGANSSDAARTADQVVNAMMEKISDVVVDGVYDAVEVAIMQQLEPAMKQAFIKRGKAGQKDAIKKRIDDVLKNVSVDFIAELEKKQEAYNETLRSRLREITREQQQGMMELNKYINQLQDQLLSIEKSGLLEEVKSLRAEVARLKKGDDSTVGVQPLAPETVASTAKSYIESGDHERGLLYALNLNNTDVTLSVLGDLDDDTRDRLFEDRRVTEETLTTAVAHLLRVSQAQNAETAVTLLNQIFLDRMALAGNSQLVGATQAFLYSWKPQLKGPALRSAKSLETALKRR